MKSLGFAVQLQMLHVYNMSNWVVSSAWPDKIFRNAEFYSPKFVWPVGPSSSGVINLAINAAVMVISEDQVSAILHHGAGYGFIVKI